MKDVVVDVIKLLVVNCSGGWFGYDIVWMLDRVLLYLDRVGIFVIYVIFFDICF